MDLRPGARVDRYELVRSLGKGGQGSVWAARDMLEGVEKAVKLCDLSTLSAHEAERARREARAVAALQHPAIVACRTSFELHAEGYLGLVFDLVVGRHLGEVLDDQRLTPERRAAILAHIAAALMHVHGRAIVHRDLKPSNVLVANSFWEHPREPGGVKLVDFGIALDTTDVERLVKTRGLVGTRPYLAPELLLPGRWHVAREGYSRDVFAFGVLAWELFTREHPTRLPFSAPREAFADAYREAAEHRRPWPPSDIAAPALTVIQACLSLDPARRPENGAALAASLGAGHLVPTPIAPLAGSALEATTEPPDLPTETVEAPRTEPATSNGPVPTTWSTARTGLHSTSVMTTPMPMLPPSVSLLHASSPPPGSIPAPPPRRRQRSSRAAWIAAAVLGSLGIIGVFGYLSADTWRGSRAEVPGPPAAPAPARTSGPAPAATAPGRATAPEPVAPVPCCPEPGFCKSGVTCRAGTCTGTLPERSWFLRLTGVAMRENGQPFKDLSSTHPEARVCVQTASQSEERVCTTIAKLASTTEGDREHRLRVRTSDLEASGVEIFVEEGGRSLAHGTSAANPGGIVFSAALCSGVKLFVGPRGTANALVFAYLDER